MKNESSGKLREANQFLLDRICEAIELGNNPWKMPWNRKLNTPRNAKTDEAYRGKNIINLWTSQAIFGYQTEVWVGYEQAKQLGGQVKANEIATPIVFMVNKKKEDADADNDDSEENSRLIPVSQGVYNIEQCDGLEALLYSELEKAENEPVLSETAQNVIALHPDMRIQHNGGRAVYTPLNDIIGMPYINLFKGDSDDVRLQNYEATLLHEMTHWTGHHKRLNRKFGAKGTTTYAKEELVAELGAAFMCGCLGYDYEKLQHAEYLSSYLTHLKSGASALSKAANEAQKAMDFLLKADKTGGHNG